MRRLTLASIFLILISGHGIALEPYKREVNPGIETYVHDYILSKSWHVDCIQITSGRSSGTKWCTLNPTSGEQSARTGIYQIVSGPKLEIWKRKNRPPLLQLGLKLQGPTGTRMAVTAGKTHLTTIQDSGGKDWRWKNEDTQKIARELLKGENVSWELIWPNGQSQSGEVNSMGFQEAWTHSVAFVGHDPLESSAAN